MLDSVSTYTTKNRIMDAAEDVVMRLGAAHLTFDVLVKETGLSKGGILYHFPNKKLLLENMVQRMIAGFEDRRRKLATEAGETGMGGARTYIIASMEPAPRDHLSTTSLMAAAASDPELLRFVREYYQRTFDEIRSLDKDAGLVSLIYMAVEGVWLLDSFELCLFTDEERHSLKKLLLNLAEARKFKFSVTGGQA